MKCPKCKSRMIAETEREKHREATVGHCLMCGNRDYTGSVLVPVNTTDIFGWRNLREV